MNLRTRDFATSRGNISSEGGSLNRLPLDALDNLSKVAGPSREQASIPQLDRPKVRGLLWLFSLALGRSVDPTHSKSGFAFDAQNVHLVLARSQCSRRLVQSANEVLHVQSLHHAAARALRNSQSLQRVRFWSLSSDGSRFAPRNRETDPTPLMSAEDET